CARALGTWQRLAVFDYW
nr:immunoglobulin heavy chain junction region [Macaca mulatta]MOW94071.1 immunoglobulin heavy chain junction region [Macaca mulatta]MOW94124.1 immunoglobulin heavy chain junction region [Macaca mulatta]MOW94713.1 immunoglobulin heavy chain junction region [Macaca mulatta]MOW95420.1 immunoglobulin heavy chain junction region [Macaca mulatta]